MLQKKITLALPGFCGSPVWRKNKKRAIFCCVVNIVAAVAEISTLAFYILYVAGSPTLLCILGRHLLINLKEAGEKGFNEGTNYWPTHVSTMDFARSEAGDILTSGEEYLAYSCVVSDVPALSL